MVQALIFFLSIKEKSKKCFYSFDLILNNLIINIKGLVNNDTKENFKKLITYFTRIKNWLCLFASTTKVF